MKEILDLGLSLLLVIGTALLAWYTYKLVDESRQVRKAQIQPFITLNLHTAETDPTLKFIVIKNVGKGAAYNLQFDIKKDFSNTFGTGAHLLGSRGIFKEGLQCCPPDYSKTYFIMETKINYEEKMKEELIVIVKYQNSFKEITEDIFHLRIKDEGFSTTVSPAPTYIGRISENIAAIKKLLEASQKNENI